MDAKVVSDRITSYLASGGLFNPELANHDAVRDLLIDARAQLDLLASAEGDSDEVVRRLNEGARIAESCDGDAEFYRKAASHILALKAELTKAERERDAERKVATEKHEEMRAALESERAVKAELASVKAHAEAMAEVLGWLNRLGGLGLDKHAQIEKVLVAYRTAHPKDAP